MEFGMDEDDALGSDLRAMRPDQTDAFACSLQALVRRSLFGAAGDPFRLGRFTVLEPLGSGGMGIVFVAYDPDLDRKIALKVLRNHGERGRREVLREGRALARLKHPNVVAVYEVGVVDDSVFVAMEYVEGQNLRAWLATPRTATEILERLVEAGRGLAAAHAVELAHHDFKPENLVIDAAGHARVIDFGMARQLEELQETGRVVTDALARTMSVHGGTPLYMAPERLAGASGDRMSDQYSFCVTAWEALFGGRPGEARAAAASGRGVPGWLRRVLERGLAREPARRWPSMAALLAALERGNRRARVWRVAAVVAGLAAVVGAAEGLRRQEVAKRVAGCAAAGAEIEAVWSDEARQRVRAAFAATGVSDAAATADGVILRIDEQTGAWARARTEACLNAEVRAVWSAETFERAASCLDDRRMDVEALAGTFAQADTLVMYSAPRTVGGLKSTDACLDEGLLQRGPAPPEGDLAGVRAMRVELSRARLLGLAGDFSAGLTAATNARVAAEGFDWPPLWAAARALEGAYLEETGAYERAEATSKEAYFAAAKAGAWGIAADAATKLIIITGYRLARHEDGRTWARHAELAIAYAGDWGGLAEAWRLSNLANVLESAGTFAEARALHEQALAIWERTLGPDHPEVAIALSNLGNLDYETGAYDEARALHARVLALYERTYGPDNIQLAMPLNNLAIAHMGGGAHAEARALAGRALAIRERVLGPEHPLVAESLNNLGAMLATVGAYAEARPLFERSLAVREKILGPHHLEVATSLSNLAAVDYETGAYAEARRLTERVRAIQERVLGADNPHVATTLTLLANVNRKTGAYAEAQPLLERALAILEKKRGPNHPELAGTLIDLGELYLEMHRPREALPLLERAVAIYDEHPGGQLNEPEAHFAVARALVAIRGDLERALVEAGKARDGFQAEGAGKQQALAVVERWLAGHATVGR